MCDDDGNVIALGTSLWALIDANTMKLRKLTEEIENKYGIINKSAFEEEFTGKLTENKDMEEVYKYKTVRRDIDVNHHVNNVNYLEIAYNAIPKDIDVDFENVEIQYKKQIKLRRNCVYLCKNAR